MTFTMLSSQSVGVTVSASTLNAQLSNLSLSSSDSTVFTVAPDTSNPLGGILTGVAAGTATLSATATATIPNTAPSSLSGSVTIVLTGPPDALVFTFGTPTP
jgi:hypothetical protein